MFSLPFVAVARTLLAICAACEPCRLHLGRLSRKGCRNSICLNDLCLNAFCIRAHDDASARVGESAKRPNLDDRTDMPGESSRSASRKASKSGTQGRSGKQRMDSEAIIAEPSNMSEKSGKRGEAAGSGSALKESCDVPAGAGRAAAERGAGGSKSRGKGPKG